MVKNWNIGLGIDRFARVLWMLNLISDKDKYAAMREYSMWEYSIRIKDEHE